MSKEDKVICIAVLIWAIVIITTMIIVCCDNKNEDYISGMPCENTEQFERWYETYDEQETSEEESDNTEGVYEQIFLEESGTEEFTYGVFRIEESSSEVETENESYLEASEVQEVEQGTESSGICKYSIMGSCIDEDVQERLYMVLDEKGISYWYEVALCQLFQESRGYQYAVSKDGKDHGILQYRLQYWDGVCRQYGFSGASIYDIDVQIRIYAAQTANRLNHGLSVDEVISRHKTSDEVSVIDWGYVAEVKQWLDKMEVIK